MYTMFGFSNKVKPCDVEEFDNSRHKIYNTRDTIWQNNLVELFDSVNTAYVWQYRQFINPECISSSGFIAVSSGCYQITGYTKEEMLSTKQNILYELLNEKDYERYLGHMKEFVVEGKSDSMIQWFDLKNGKKIMVNVILHEKTTDYLDFIGITTDMPHKEQLDLILENSEDMVMIDDGIDRIFTHMYENKIDLSTYSHKEMLELPNHLMPTILYVSSSYKNFGFDENPVGKKILKYVDFECIQGVLLKFIKISMNDKKKPFFLVHGKMNGIDVEINISKMGNKLLSVVRNITDRIKRFEAEKELAIQTMARKKDAEANSFIRHEVKNGLFSAQAQILGLKEMYINAMKSNDVYQQEFHHDILNRYNEVEFELDTTLQTILSDAMAKDIINDEYVSKKEKINIIDLLGKIKGDRYKWFLNPNDFPNILSDPLLIFYIIRNALSNANKYGEQWGDIIISININNKKLTITIKNFPGENHDKLVNLENPNIIFEKGVRLHKHEKKNSKGFLSAGDGAWVMQTCAKLCNGLCEIVFNNDHTLFTFSANVELAIESSDYKNFKFPENTFVYIIDDSRIQRRMMKRQLEKIQANDLNIIVLGDGEEEIKNLSKYLIQCINNNPEQKHIIICDENLDYKINGTLHCESGSLICKEIYETINKNKQYNKDNNFITFIRSANDSDKECDIYLERADGILPKAMLTTYELKEKILKVWMRKFGFVKSSTINYNFEGDMKEIIEIFLEDIDDFVAQPPSGYDWPSFWSELHKLKGTLNILNETTNNTPAIAIIESLRDNNFDSDFDTLWHGLCEELQSTKINVKEILNTIYESEQNEK